MIRRLRLLSATILTLLCSASFGQTSIPANTIVTQNFNSLGTSATAGLPANWKMSSAGNGVAAWLDGTNVTSITQAANTGLPTTGGRYNWATASNTDRAIGFMTDAGYASSNSIMAHYRNTTGAAVNSITIAFAIERYVVNTSAVSVAFSSSTDGTVWTAQTAGDIGSVVFATGSNTGTFASPQTIYKTVTINSLAIPDNGTIYFRWVFTNTGNTSAQGLGLDDVSVFAGAATPALTAQLRDILQVDNGTHNQFNAGDVIRYQTVIKNIGTGDANNVQINIPAPSNTTLVPGSVKTSAVAIDDNYATAFNTPLAGPSVLANDYGVPTPTAVISFGSTSDATIYNVGTTGSTNAGGLITLNANGTFTYTPPTGFSGVDQFKYITGNGNLPNNDAVVNITVVQDIAFTTTNADPLCNGGANGSITINASGGNDTLTYSITGAAGTYQASNVFTGLAAGVYNLAVKDAGGTIKTGTATLNNPAAIVVNGTMPQLTYNTAMSTATFTKTGGTGTIVWSAAGLPTGVTINSSTGDVTGTPTATGSFNAVITATDGNGCAGTKNISFTVAPKLVNNAYTVIGNTQLVANGHSTPTTPFTTDATNITANDQSDALIMVTAGNFTTTNGGSITIDASGKFTYTPKSGSNTVDSYTYTATSNSVSATATINFTVTNMVWYVNNATSSSTNDGRSNTPFKTMTAANSALTGAGDYIYVYKGTGSTTGTYTMKTSQKLIGAGATLNVGSGLLIITGNTLNSPTLSGTITLASSVTVDGIDLNTATANAIIGNSITGINVTARNVTTTTGAAITIGGTGNTGTMTFTQVNTNGAPNGIVLNNFNGSFRITGDGANWGSGGSIQNTTGADGATTGNGIYLNNVSNVSFNFMLLNGHQNNAIYGTAVRGFDLNKTRFTGNNGTSNSGLYNESVVHLVDLGGAVSIKNSYFSGGAYNTVLIENISGTNPVISSLVMDTDTLTTMQGSTADVRSTALLVNLMDGSLTSGTIQNCKVDYWWGNAIHVLSQGTSSGTVSILNNTCNNTNGALAGAGGIWVAGGTLNYIINGNNIQNTNGTAISADRGNFGGLMKGTISNNIIGTSGVANSGSFTGIAIFASHHGAGTTTTTINNNIIRQINGSANGAITVLMGDDVGFGDVGGGNFNVTINGNNIQESGTTANSAQHGILVTAGVTSSGSLGGDNGVGCFNISGNSITNFNMGSAATAQNRIRINQRFHVTSRFPGYTGANNDNAALGAYLLGRNVASNTANANNVSGWGGPGFTNTPGGVPCAQ